MALKVGQILNGGKWCYRLTEALSKGVHQSTVFKAEMLPGHIHSLPSKWALVKTTSPDRKRFLECEYETYIRPNISSSTSFRSMYDIVGKPEDFSSETDTTSPCLILEWMDCTLTEVSSEQYGQNYPLVKAMVEATLSGLAALDIEGLVHTDIKPDNILLTDIDTIHPIVKLGDLGLTTHSGFKEWEVQPFAMRAPEVWRGLGCIPRSDVWSLAVTLIDWYKPGIFGVRDNKDGHWPEPWCISKLMRLFPDWTVPHIDNSILRGNYELAELFIEAPDPKNPQEMYIKTESLDTELQDVKAPPELLKLISSLLIVDPDRRPSAAEAMKSPEYRELLAKETQM